MILKHQNFIKLTLKGSKMIPLVKIKFNKIISKIDKQICAKFVIHQKKLL